MNLTAAQQNSIWSRLTARIRNSPPMRYPDLGLICVGVFVMLIGVGAILPIRAIYARDHGATMAELGLMASGFLLGQFVSQLPGGWASDKWGRKPLLVGGIAISGLISFLFLLNDQPWYFIALRFIEGAASGAISPAANAYVIDAVPARDRGSAFGWLGAAFSAGLMMGPALGGLMGDELGYTAPFIFGGIITLLAALFLMLKMSNLKPGAKQPDVEEPAQATAEANARARRQIPKKLFIPAFVGALVFTIAAGFGDGLFISIWTLWLNDLHASNSFIGLTFITFSLPLMVLMPVTGKWADKYRLSMLIALPGILISFVYVTYGFLTNLLVIAGIGVVEGTLIAIMGPALSAYIADLSPTEGRGRLQGIISTVRTIAGFGSSMLVAILYGMSMLYPFLMLASVQLVISVVGGLLVWRVERRTETLAGANTHITQAETGSAPVLEGAGK
ncbi:MAG: MFS transporter [Chloroflexi bacterium]|nr:MFS transporter [Chloroflexota bacterium]